MIRPARPSEAGRLAAIDASANINPWHERQFAAACSDEPGKHDFALVAEEQDRVAGFVVYSQVLDEASIHSIAVDAPYQRRGIGRLLLAAALTSMQRIGVVRCMLEVRRANIAALRLYEGNGFSIDGVRKDYYPTQSGREDALLMSRVI